MTKIYIKLISIITFLLLLFFGYLKYSSSQDFIIEPKLIFNPNLNSIKFWDQKIYISASDNTFSLKKNSEINLSLENFRQASIKLEIYKIPLEAPHNRHPSEYSNYISDFSKDIHCNTLIFNNANNSHVKNFSVKELIGYDCFYNLSKDAFLYYGVISISNNLNKNEYTFYFNFERKISNKKKILYIFPSSNFFNYYLSFKNRKILIEDSRKNNIYFFQPTSISPIHKGLFFKDNEKLLQKNKQLFSAYVDIHDNINVVNDYDLTEEIILNHDLIILPNYLEFINHKFLINILNKAKYLNKNKIIISHSPTNLTKKLNLIKNVKNELVGLKFSYPINNKKFVHGYRICKYDSDLDFVKRYGEMEDYTLIKNDKDLLSWDTTNSFFSYSCNNDSYKKTYPLIYVKKSGNLTLVEFNNSTAGRSFGKSRQLNFFIKNIIKENINLN